MIADCAHLTVLVLPQNYCRHMEVLVDLVVA